MKNPIVAREGWLYLSSAFVVAVGISWISLPWSVPGWVFFLFLLQFFRDPIRKILPRDDAVLAPADGRVVSVGKTLNPYTGEESLKISIFMNFFNVHSNRIPVTGVIEKISYYPGKFFNAELDKASLKNERNALIILSATGDRITCVQVAGLVARRISCDVREGEKVNCGDRYGFIRFGSRLDIYLPSRIKPQVVIEDRVVSGQTVLAEF